MSQSALGEKIGLDRQAISRYEKQAYPPIDFIINALQIVRPKEKLFEFFAEEGELDKYLPSWITKDDALALRFINSLDKEHRDFSKQLSTAS